MTSRVEVVPPADPARAAVRFATRLEFETDCADVHDDLADGRPGFVLLDSRSATAYAEGHAPGARNLPHADIGPATTADLPRDRLLVTYCWGPHCNGATRAAARLAALGFRVKEMIGGISGWLAEGYPLATGPEPGGLERPRSAPDA